MNEPVLLWKGVSGNIRKNGKVVTLGDGLENKETEKMQIKCSKCGNAPTDQTKFAWKCNSCGKAYGMTLSALQQLENKLKLSKDDIMCKNCGNILTDGKEQIYWKCQCGNLQRHTLKDFAKNEPQKTSITKKNASHKNILKIFLFGMSIVVVGVSMFFVGLAVGSRKAEKSVEQHNNIQTVEEEKNQSSEVTENTPEPTSTQMQTMSFLDYIDMEFEKYDFLKKDFDTNNRDKKMICVKNCIEDKKYFFDEFYISPIIIYNDDGKREFTFFIYKPGELYALGITSFIIKSNSAAVNINNSFLIDNGRYGGYIIFHDNEKSNQYNRNYKKIKDIFLASTNISCEINGKDYHITKKVIKEYREFFKIYDQMITTYKDNLD